MKAFPTPWPHRVDAVSQLCEPPTQGCRVGDEVGAAVGEVVGTNVGDTESACVEESDGESHSETQGAVNQKKKVQSLDHISEVIEAISALS